MTAFAEVELKGWRGRVAFESERAVEYVIDGGAFETVADSTGTVWAAPVSRLPEDRDQAIESDPRTLADFGHCPEGDAFGAAVWARRIEEGEAALAGLFPTRREVLSARDEWPTKAPVAESD